MATDIATASIAGSWWRHVPAGVDPVRRPDPPRDGRWQRGDVADAVYLADSAQTAWAEWYRWLAEFALAPRVGLPRDLWRAEVAIEAVVDLRTAVALSALGLPAPLPERDQWPAYQAVGEALHADGATSLAAPSAAREGGFVLCVFLPPGEGARLDYRSSEEIAEPPTVPRRLRT